MNNLALQALTDGLLDGGCVFASNFPGFYSQNIFTMLGGKRISLNEKIAYQQAYGASLAGQRACVSFKNVGLNVAADAYLNSLLSGVNAGLVIVVTDDMQVEGSQSRQDSRHYRDFFGGLWLEPSSLDSAYEFGYRAFDWSEKFDLPVVIRLTNQFFDLTGDYDRQPKRQNILPPADDKEKYIVHPTNWRRQFNNLQINNKRLAEFSEEQMNNKAISADCQTIACGCCLAELAQHNLTPNEALSCEIYPLPLKFIQNKFKTKPALAVIEQGDAYAGEIITAALADKKIEINSETGQLPDNSAAYRVWNKLEKLFVALINIQPDYVVSDLTQFTVESLNAVDSCLCLGSAISVGNGLAAAGLHPFCLTGDVSFLHEGGRNALEETIARQARQSIIIIDNGGAWCTGGQQPAIDIDLKNILSLEYFELDYNQTSAEDLEKTLKKMKYYSGVSLLKLKYYDRQ